MRALILLSIALVLAGCANNADPSDDANATPTATPAMPGGGATAVSVSLVDRTPGVGIPPTTMGISPATLELVAGQLVNLTVTNDGAGPHDLVIEGLDVATESIPPGESVTVEFTPMEAGTYKMYCSIGGDAPTGHDAQGMHGEVVVS